MPTPAPVIPAVIRYAPVTLVVDALAASPAFAQSDTPPRPAHIHDGTCATLRDVVFPPSEVANGGPMGTPMAGTAPTPAAAMMATPSADEGEPVAWSATTAATAIDDLLAAPHAIDVHASAEDIGISIACGVIAGSPTNGRLTVDLDAPNGSGVTGEAMLDSADGEISVEIRLYPPAERASGGTPETAPTQDAQRALTVDILNFAYDPNPVTVPVGGSVTWTNSDPVPHTATARDRDALQIGTIEAGERATVTFEAAGEYHYFSEFHGGMMGTVVVE